MAVHGIRIEGSHRGSHRIGRRRATVALKDNVCTAEVLATLDLLAANATVKWPFEQFRNPLVADKGTHDLRSGMDA